MEPRQRPSWLEYGLSLARTAATRSQDPYVQVGAVILRSDRSVASVGYNGPPPGVEVDWSDRDARRPLMIHAEINAFRYATIDDCWQGTLYVTGIPCPSCVTAAAAHGIGMIVFGDFLESYPFEETLAVCKACSINIATPAENKTPDEIAVMEKHLASGLTEGILDALRTGAL